MIPWNKKQFSLKNNSLKKKINSCYCESSLPKVRDYIETDSKERTFQEQKD